MFLLFWNSFQTTIREETKVKQRREGKRNGKPASAHADYSLMSMLSLRKKDWHHVPTILEQSSNHNKED